MADLTGDGVPEITAYAQDSNLEGAGRVWIFPSTLTGTHAKADVGWSIIGFRPNGAVGYDAAIGDVTGDGEPDLVSGAFLSNGRGGETYVYAGPVAADGSFADAVATIGPQGPNEWCGAAVEVLRDQDGDGYDEVVVACAGDKYGVDRPGRVEIYAGASAVGRMDGRDATLVLHTGNDRGQSSWDRFGETLLAEVDWSGDGLEDLAIGSPGEVRDGREGGVYLLDSPLKLAKRWFVVRNVHAEDATILVHPRHTITWMRGPVTRIELRAALATAPSPSSPPLGS